MIEQNCHVSEAANLMRERGVRRVLVCDAERQLVGIVSLGDLALRLDPNSALGEIAAQPGPLTRTRRRWRRGPVRGRVRSRAPEPPEGARRPR